MDEEDEGSHSIHPVSQPEVDKVVKQIISYVELLEIPIHITKICEGHDVSVYDVVNELTDRGFKVDWDDPQNPAISAG